MTGSPRPARYAMPLRMANRRFSHAIAEGDGISVVAAVERVFARLYRERFPIRRAGQADITWNRGGWITRGTLTLATRMRDGMPLSDDAVYTVALHEIGHLLGLGHSDDPHDVMYPTTEVHDITARDRRSFADYFEAVPSARFPAGTDTLVTGAPGWPAEVSDDGSSHPAVLEVDT